MKGEGRGCQCVNRQALVLSHLRASTTAMCTRISPASCVKFGHELRLLQLLTCVGGVAAIALQV